MRDSLALSDRQRACTSRELVLSRPLLPDAWPPIVTWPSRRSTTATSCSRMYSLPPITTGMRPTGLVARRQLELSLFPHTPWAWRRSEPSRRPGSGNRDRRRHRSRRRSRCPARRSRHDDLAGLPLDARRGAGVMTVTHVDVVAEHHHAAVVVLQFLAFEKIHFVGLHAAVGGLQLEAARRRRRSRSSRIRNPRAPVAWECWPSRWRRGCSPRGTCLFRRRSPTTPRPMSCTYCFTPAAWLMTIDA